MKLYYAPLACSFAAHVACREAGLEPELVRVDLPTKRIEGGGELFTENPMGQVPTLVLDDGRVLTENVAVLTYLGDQASNGAAPFDRYELARWLSFVSTELHKKVLWAIYEPTSPDAVKDFARSGARRALKVASGRLESRDALLGESFSVADAYLYWALTLLPHAGVPLDDFPVLRRYHERHKSRPSVRGAFSFERKQFEKPFAAA